MTQNFGETGRFRLVLNVGGIRNSESLRIGVNSRFCSVLNDGGSEILNLFVFLVFKSLLYSLRELLIPNILYRSEDFCTSEQTEQLFFSFEASFLDSEQTVQIIL